MKIKKLYAEPEMKLHKLGTSRIMAGSNEHLQVDPAYPGGGEEEDDTGD